MLTNAQSLPVSPSVAWSALTDMNVLKACIPGCESLTAMSPREFTATVVAGIGPIKTKVKGIIELTRHGNEDPPASYTLCFDGYGRFIGRARGEAHVQLHAQPDGSTLLRYDAHARVSGTIARAGTHFIDMAVQELAATFFSRFSDQVRRTPSWRL